MLRCRAISVLFVALVLPASAVASTTEGAAHAGTTRTVAVTRAPSLEGLLREINAVRATRGLAKLTASTGLSRSAVAHSKSMATYGFFAHESRNGSSFSQRIKQYYVPHSSAWTVGENLAMFGGSTPTAGEIVAAWMGSPGHRANLLRDVFREAGIAVMFNPTAGGVFGGESTWVITLDLGSR